MEKKFSSNEVPLAELLERAAGGALQLPDFQRGWVWDDDHIRSLLVSISLSYPIGAIMTLVAGNPDVNFKARLLEGVTLGATPAPEMLLLDGQQRLTSLFQVLKSRAPVLHAGSARQRAAPSLLCEHRCLYRCAGGQGREGHRRRSRRSHREERFRSDGRHGFEQPRPGNRGRDVPAGHRSRLR